jgi:hypothetical protein
MMSDHARLHPPIHPPTRQTVQEGAPPDFHYVAVLRTCAGGHFKLFLNGCEACDKRCDKYTCGAGGSGGRGGGGGGGDDDRQLLAEVFHVRFGFGAGSNVYMCCI